MTDRVMKYHYKKAMECLNEGLQTMEQEQLQGEDRFYEITQIRKAISMLYSIGQLKPWVKLGISRSTYYRDQQRSKRSDITRNTKRSISE